MSAKTNSTPGAVTGIPANAAEHQSGPREKHFPYDAILLLSFGGPNAPDEVVPFLKNVTQGKNIPEARLEEVGEHYYQFGGKSPINELNLKLLDDLRSEFASRGIKAPLYWGNRNWDPYLADVLHSMHADGHRDILVITTSGFSGFSSCCQYNGDLLGALESLAPRGADLRIDRLRKYFNHPSYADANARAILAAFENLRTEHGPAVADSARLLFVTHSIPIAMNDTAGADGDAYRLEHLDLGEHVTAQVSDVLQRELDFELTYCSRSGPPSQPWLEPDVTDRIGELSKEGVEAVVLAPIGFLSDHMEVVYDLDTEAKEAADDCGVAFARAATAGTDPHFVAGLVDLAEERAAARRQESVSCPVVGKLGPGAACWPVANCCGRPVEPIRPRGIATEA